MLTFCQKGLWGLKFSKDGDLRAKTLCSFTRVRCVPKKDVQELSLPGPCHRMELDMIPF